MLLNVLQICCRSIYSKAKTHTAQQNVYYYYYFFFFTLLKSNHMMKYGQHDKLLDVSLASSNHSHHYDLVEYALLIMQ